MESESITEVKASAKAMGRRREKKANVACLYAKAILAAGRQSRSGTAMNKWKDCRKIWRISESGKGGRGIGLCERVAS